MKTIPGKKRKARWRQAFPRASRTVRHLGDIRRLSRDILREHHRKAAAENVVASINQNGTR